MLTTIYDIIREHPERALLLIIMLAMWLFYCMNTNREHMDGKTQPPPARTIM